jgi:gliding motility-associated-like protein
MTKPLILFLPLIASSALAQTCDSVTAGPDQTVCAGAPIQLQGAAPGINTVVSSYWTGGSGTYVPNNSFPDAMYYPTAAETAAGSVDLQFHLTYTGVPVSVDASLLAYDHMNEDSVFYISPVDGSVQGVQSNSGNDLTAMGFQSGTNLLFGISNIVEPARLYQIDVITNVVTMLIDNLGNYYWAGDFDNPNQLFYLIGIPYGTAQPQGLYKFDFSSGAPVGFYVGPLNLTGDNNILFYAGGDGINGLAYDPNTSKLYGVSFNGQLYDINTATGNATLIGNCPGGLRGLAYDYTTNKLWGCDASANLYELEETTGAVLTTVNCQSTFSYVTSLTYAPGLLAGQSVTCVDNVHFDIVDCSTNCTSEIVAVGDTCVQEGYLFTVTSDSAIVDVAWSFGDPGSGVNNTAGTVNAGHTFSAAGTYTVTAIVNLDCGTDTLFETVTVVDCTSPEPVVCQLTVPNVFTPNADAINDSFAPGSNCAFDHYSCFILNRWGELVYTATAQNDKWDGKSNGTDCSEGVYFYMLTYRFPGQQAETVHGMVTLVRE